MYSKLGRWCFNHPWRVIGAWVAIFVLVGVLTRTVGNAYDGGFDTPDSESTQGAALLGEYFGGIGGGNAASIVFQAPQGIDDPEVQATMTEVFEAIQNESGEGEVFDGMSSLSPYSPGAEQNVNSDRTVAFANLSISTEIDQESTALMGERIAELIEESDADEVDGLRIEVGGQALAEFEPPESELLGVAFAVIVLIVAMGSVVAMGTTIAVALTGVGIGVVSIGLASNLVSLPDIAVTIGLMIGLGVGIDYALFIVTRYREALAQGFDPESATAVALDTAGRSVIFAGFTVVVSLLGLLLIGLAFVAGLGIGAAITVAVVMMASISLLPAALGLVRDRVNTTKWRGLIASVIIAVGILALGLSLGLVPFAVAAALAIVVLILGYLPFNSPLKTPLKPRKEKPLRETVWYRWSRSIQNRPWVYAIASTAVLAALSIPLLSLNLGFSDEGNFPEETTTRQAYDLVAEGFGAGANGPLIVVTELDSPADFPTMQALSAAVGQTDGVAFASPPIPNDPENPGAAIIQVQPEYSPQDERTEELVIRLRESVIPDVVAGTDLAPKLAGATAANIDFTDYLSGRILLFFGVVLSVSFLLLMAVFRSLLVPLKAVIMNMLSIGAAYGIVVMVFQFGWGAGLFGFDAAPIEPFLPMLMFAIVFGLSMDYEVFILSRMKEEFERTGDADNSVADGLAATARVITAAAAIMMVVFGSFVFEDSRTIKLFGLGLASAVFIDASIVRMVLVPSTMQLLGARNWWLPGWLDRILPNLNVEGEHHEPPAGNNHASSIDQGPDPRVDQDTDPGEESVDALV